LIVVLIFAIASTVFSIVGPKILGNATTKLFEGIMGQITGSSSGVDFAYIGNILLGWWGYTWFRLRSATSRDGS
jgi:ATP-binding cassette subfamily B protein